MDIVRKKKRRRIARPTQAQGAIPSQTMESVSDAYFHAPQVAQPVHEARTGSPEYARAISRRSYQEDTVPLQAPSMQLSGSIRQEVSQDDHSQDEGVLYENTHVRQAEVPQASQEALSTGESETAYFQGDAYQRHATPSAPQERSIKVIRLGREDLSDDVPMFYESDYVVPQEVIQEELVQEESVPQESFDEVLRRYNGDVSEFDVPQELPEEFVAQKSVVQVSEQAPSKWEDPFTQEVEDEPFGVKASLFEKFRILPESLRFSLSFAVSGLIVLMLLGAISFVSSGLQLKGRVLGVSQEAYSSIEDAAQSIKNSDFESSSVSFREANTYFTQAAEDFESWGGFLARSNFSVPFLSQITTGKSALEAGKHLTSAGEKMNGVIAEVALLENPFDENSQTSLLEVYKGVISGLQSVDEDLALAEDSIALVKISHLPDDKREEFIALRDALPKLRANLQEFVGNSDAFIDVFGGNGPRKFLFLFQNNQELRATGGFIGSYGLLDISDGEVRKFFVDGIFNPDGQLSVDVIPPRPIRKISAGWSLHDSNWFADFPVSAEKAIYFYEKTGGATVDGVITITPTVMERLLEVTGPIYMEDYDVTIDSDNFIRSIQYKVEVDYDKEENRPKKILADLAPILMERVFTFDDYGNALQTLDILHSSIQEKHILLYSRNEKLQGMYEELGWSGEVKDATHDYLSVVHTNVNGYKTDGIVDEFIEHESAIQKDGRIINTVTITREHQGGDTDYEWWNQVNSDFMRVYVPKGSRLLSAEGHTQEYNEDPLDYEALGFHEDNDVVAQERTMLRDPDTGTYIFEEAGKTVFGNWVYVSPKETVTVQYTYELPFTLDVQKIYDTADSYSLLVQKQSGTIGPSLNSSVSLPSDWDVEWMYPENMHKQDNELLFEGSLEKDVFSAIVLKKD